MTRFRMSKFRPELEREAVRFGLPPETICIVPSIRKYWARVGEPHLEQSDSRAAMCVWDEQDKPLVLMRDETTPQQHADALVPLLVRGFPREQTQRLNDPLTFARHLFLHEIAHFLRCGTHANLGLDAVERDCDSWAFEQL